MNEEVVMERRLFHLQERHRELDAQINNLSKDNGLDELTVVRLKKQKLQLRDQIHYLMNVLSPDIPA